MGYSLRSSLLASPGLEPSPHKLWQRQQDLYSQHTVPNVERGPICGGQAEEGNPALQPHSPGTYPQHQVVGDKARTTEVLASWEESPPPGSRGERACVPELQPSGLAGEGAFLVQIPQTLPFPTKLSLIFLNACFFTCHLPLGTFPEASNGWVFKVTSTSLAQTEPRRDEASAG